MVTVVCVAAVLFSSCDSLVNLSTSQPFSLSGFEIKKGAIDKVCHVASASFYFINTSNKDITAFTLNFRLYDGDKKPIGTGDNKVIFKYSGLIKAGEEKQIIVSLDRFIPQETGSGIVADHIFVESVLFSTGEQWSDPFGIRQF
jgi:hypothetical protein